MTVSKTTQEQAFIATYAATYAVALKAMYSGKGFSDIDIQAVANNAGIDAVCALLNADRSCVFESEADQIPESARPVGPLFVTIDNTGIHPDAIADLSTGRRFWRVEKQADGSGIVIDGHGNMIGEVSAQDMEIATRRQPVRIEEKFNKPFIAYMVGKRSMKRMREHDFNIRDLGRSAAVTGDEL